MGRAAVRTAVTEWLDTAAIPMLGTVLRSRPKLINPALLEPSLGQASGSVIVVHLIHDVEIRTAVGGAKSGEKFNKHDITLEILFQSKQPDALVAQDDFDALIDGIMGRLRQDRTLGAPGVIWQCPDAAGYDLLLAQPVLGAQTVLITAHLTMTALEYVQA